MTIRKTLEEALLKIQQEYGLVITDVKVDWSKYAYLDGATSFHISGVEFEGEVHQPYNTSKEMGL